METTCGDEKVGAGSRYKRFCCSPNQNGRLSFDFSFWYCGKYGKARLTEKNTEYITATDHGTNSYF